jgi:hypothetical protein
LSNLFFINCILIRLGSQKLLDLTNMLKDRVRAEV